jgi:hypothetical protein
MKKLASLLLGIVLVGSTASCSKNTGISNNSSGQTAFVPSGTQFEVSIPTEISTGRNHAQDRFTLPVHSPLVGANPGLKGAKVEAHLEDVVKAGHGRKASLHLIFDDVVLKDGTVEPINAQLLNTKVETKTQGKFLKNVGIIMGGAVAGHLLGNKLGTKQGGLGGAAAATAFVLASPGGEVVLKKGTELDVKLKSPLEVAKAGT